MINFLMTSFYCFFFEEFIAELLRLHLAQPAEAAAEVHDPNKALIRDVEWRKIGEITTSLNGEPRGNKLPSLKHKLTLDTTPLDVFLQHSLPAGIIPDMMQGTNGRPGMALHCIDYEKCVNFMGALISFTLVPPGDRRDLWATESTGPFPAPNLGHIIFLTRQSYFSALN